MAVVATLVFSGCARFTTNQEEVRYEGGQPSNSIRTKVGAYTLFSSRNALSNFKATQSEKTQGAQVGSLNQQGATNTVEMLDSVVRLLQTLRPTP